MKDDKTLIIEKAFKSKGVRLRHSADTINAIKEAMTRFHSQMTGSMISPVKSKREWQWQRMMELAAHIHGCDILGLSASGEIHKEYRELSEMFKAAGTTGKDQETLTYGDIKDLSKQDLDKHFKCK